MSKKNGRRILVVDDNPDILDAIQFTLETAAYEVKTIDKTEYVENLHHNIDNLPDLIILDVLLSGKDGRKICEKLKCQEQTKHIPIIMISAQPNVEKSSKDVGADDFLAKPFDIDMLLHKVSNYM